MPKLKKFMPWIGGMGIGVVASVALGGILLIFAFREDDADPAFELIAVSWGTPMDSTNLWIYQVQVTAVDPGQNGVLDVSARGCIGGSSYFHDFGLLGTAKDKGEAVRKYGEIVWESDRVTIGGEDGIKAAVRRQQLERHR